MSEKLEILTPVGRLVQGNPFIPNTTDSAGAPLVHKSGPKMGQPREEYYCGIAIPKTDPLINEVIGKMQQAAQAGFPGGQFNAPDFSWKIIDGDTVDRNGQPYANRPGFAGCYVLRFASGYAPQCYVRDASGQLAQSTDPNSIKRGYYIRIYGTTSGNNSQQSPGIYLNLSMVELVGYGEEIISGPDANAAFGGAAQLPPGASATPMAPTTPIAAPGMAPQQAAPGMAPQQAAPGMAPQQAAPGMAPQQAAPGMVAPGVQQPPAIPGAVPSATPTGAVPGASVAMPNAGFLNPQQ